jgi:hypothetical protein
MSNNIGLKVSQERPYPSEDEGKRDVWKWFEVLIVDDTFILLLGEPHGIHNVLNIFVAIKALPVSLRSVHDLDNVIRVAYTLVELNCTK